MLTHHRCLLSSDTSPAPATLGTQLSAASGLHVPELPSQDNLDPDSPYDVSGSRLADTTAGLRDLQSASPSPVDDGLNELLPSDAISTTSLALSVSDGSTTVNESPLDDHAASKKADVWDLGCRPFALKRLSLPSKHSHTRSLPTIASLDLAGSVAASHHQTSCTSDSGDVSVKSPDFKCPQRFGSPHQACSSDASLSFTSSNGDKENQAPVESNVREGVPSSDAVLCSPSTEFSFSLPDPVPEDQKKRVALSEVVFERLHVLRPPSRDSLKESESEAEPQHDSVDDPGEHPIGDGEKANSSSAPPKRLRRSANSEL